MLFVRNVVQYGKGLMRSMSSGNYFEKLGLKRGVEEEMEGMERGRETERERA